MSQQRINYGERGKLTGADIDPVQLMLDRIPDLISEARSLGRRDAHSYRDFHVAGAVIGINQDTDTLWTDVAGNLKRQGKDKICVERKLQGKARKQGMTDILGFVILGTTDRALIRDVTGLPTPTLHLCGDCRREIPASPLVSPNTIVLTSGLESDENQVFQAGSLVDAYGRIEAGESAQELFNYQPDFKDWKNRELTYQALAGKEWSGLEVTERLRLASLALNRTVTT